MKRTELISKIQALLRLGRHASAQPGESANALAAAQRLMREHSIVIDEEAEFVAERTEVGMRITLARDLAMRMVINRCNVRIVSSLPDVVILGRVAEVTFATYAIDFLRSSCARAVSTFAKAEEQRRRRMTPRKRSDFIQGWFHGVRHNWPKTLPSSEGERALALQNDERLDVFEKSLFPRTEARESTAPKIASKDEAKPRPSRSLARRLLPGGRASLRRGSYHRAQERLAAFHRSRFEV